MPLPTSASDVTETIKNAAQANGSIAQAARAATGAPVRASRNVVISSRPMSAIAAIVKSSTVARSLGFAPPLSGGSSAPRVGIVSAHTGGKSLITVSGDNYDLYTFLNTGNNTFVVDDGNITADIFLLGGGGGGAGAGGGGGGLLIATNVAIPMGTYSVRVGAGGVANERTDRGLNGGDSTMTISGTLYSGVGGGGGAPYGAAGSNGGCGGGGGAQEAGGTGSQGGNGGSSYGVFGNGGGGGMGGNGEGSNGGSGLSSTFTGTAVTYGGGGAGASDGSLCTPYGCNGGSGGGGGPRTNGTTGLGGGGGGAWFSGQWPGQGGSGRVMIRIRK